MEEILVDNQQSTTEITKIHPRINMRILKDFITASYECKINKLKSPEECRNIRNVMILLANTPIFAQHETWLANFKWSLRAVTKNAHFIAKIIHANMNETI